ncbi:MAG: UPF0147 family protein [Thaumarchaeota archaeon]|nr:UPF0147 family protein [Nitrososphaerota archaeon]
MNPKKAKQNEENLMKSIATLQSVSESPTTPRNIRKIIKDTITTLQNTTLSLGVRAANAISMLDEVSQDPNMPSFTRVTIWSAVSTLESIRD